MDLITLAGNIANATTLIETGRKGFATRGKKQEGRINYIACHSYKTRLKNILKTPGLDPAWTQCVHVRKSPSQTAACKPAATRTAG